MLAQWLIRCNPAEWRKGETAEPRRLAAAYLSGLAVAVLVMLVMAAVTGTGSTLAVATLGWLAWAGLVALTVWRLVRRMDRQAAQRRPVSRRPAAPAKPDGRVAHHWAAYFPDRSLEDRPEHRAERHAP